MMYSTGNLRDFSSEHALIPSLIRSKKTAADIKELLLEKEAVIADGYGHEVYACSKCGEFYSRFLIRLNYDGGSYEREYKCTKCSSALKVATHLVSDDDDEWGEQGVDWAKYSCPQCGQHSLFENGPLLLWD